MADEGSETLGAVLDVAVCRVGGVQVSTPTRASLPGFWDGRRSSGTELVLYVENSVSHSGISCCAVKNEIN